MEFIQELLARMWDFISNAENRSTLAWIFGLPSMLGIGYFVKKKRKKAGTESAAVNADNGSIAIGGNASNNSLKIKNEKS